MTGKGEKVGKIKRLAEPEAKNINSAVKFNVYIFYLENLTRFD